MKLICKKVLAHSSLEPPLEYNQYQMPLNGEIYNIYNLHIIKNTATIVSSGNFTKETLETPMGRVFSVTTSDSEFSEILGCTEKQHNLIL